MSKRIADCMYDNEEACLFINKLIERFIPMSTLCQSKQELSTDAQGVDALF